MTETDNERAAAAQRLEQLRATAHPLRLRMLSLLTGASMSAAEIARELDVTQANASYHLRLLERAGLVRLVEEVKLRGGVARRFRHESSSEPFAVAEPTTTDEFTDAHTHFIALLADAMRERGTRRAPGPSVNTDAELWVAPEVWRKVVEMVGEASALLHSSAAPPRSKGAVPVSMTTALFRVARADGSGADKAEPDGRGVAEAEPDGRGADDAMADGCGADGSGADEPEPDRSAADAAIADEPAGDGAGSER
ncbi:hypothetical protein GCM10028798_12250 [Humibacter antri]